MKNNKQLKYRSENEILFISKRKLVLQENVIMPFIFYFSFLLAFFFLYI